MGIAAIVVGIVGLLALTATAGSARAAETLTPPQPQPPQPWQPNLPSTFNPPMTPSTSANVTGQVFSGGAQIGTQLGTQTLKNSGALSGAGLTAATTGIAAGVGIGVSIITQLLAAHEARLHGAQHENQAVDQYIPVFDSFIKQLVDAYNSKQITAAQAAQAAQQFDRYIYNAFRSLTGGPGTSWSDQEGSLGHCNKACTVGCCIYYNALGSPLNNISFVLGFPTGKWGQVDTNFNIRGRTIVVPKVYPSKYSSFTRPLYMITLN
jgi:hypothetical protein